jgi:hypothetical protein
MSSRGDRPVRAERKEAVQIRLSRGLARQGMMGSWCCMITRCMLQARLQAHFLSQYFPIRVPSLDGHVPTISPRVSYLARLHAWRCFVLPNPQTSSKKKWSRQLPGNIHQSTCQESPCQFATPGFDTEFSRKCPKQDYVSRRYSLSGF